MSFLTFIAAKKGIAAISEYHDEAGITIAITCTLALWGLAAWLNGRESKWRVRHSSVLKADEGRVTACPNMSAPCRLALALIVWLVMVEVGVQLWYYHVESQLKPGPAWTVRFPTENVTSRNVPIPAAVQNLLRYDEGHQMEWTQPDGTDWQFFYCQWLPGRVAGYLAKRHTPEICLQSVGMKMLSGPELVMMNINGIELPIRSYLFETDDGPIQVFQCRWEAGADNSAYVENESSRYNLVRAIWAGRGNKGQKVLEVMISGINDPDQAKAALRRELEKLIQVTN